MDPPTTKFPPLLNLTRPRNTNSIVIPDASNRNAHHSEHGPYGVITAVLMDPFSQLMDCFINNDKEGPNAMGFYYMHNQQKIITLFHNHDGTPVPWIGPHTTLEGLLKSIYVYKIKCYPLIGDHDRLKTHILHFTPPRPNYHKLLLHLVQLHSGHLETGSTLVFKILKELDPKITSLSSPIFKRHISMKSSRKDKSDPILESSRQSLESLCMVFSDLFVNKNGFRNVILNLRTNRLAKEHDLITNIVCSLEHGILSTTTVNDLITSLEQLDQHRFPKITKSKASIEVTGDELMCTFNDAPFDSTRLNKLGAYIATLPCDPILINLYNEAVKDTTLDPIPIPTITLKTAKRSIVLTIQKPDLSSLSESELKDVLIYIDSLRSSNGTSDNRYAPLQNAILEVLAKR